MKQQLISIPSTKPQQFLYTDFSIVSPASHPKHSLNKILNYIKNVLKMRLYLCYRDIQQLYGLQSQFFNRTLNTYSAEQLWKKINKNNDQILQERQMIGFFTKIVLSLTKEKNQSAQNKNFDNFADLKSTIEWLEDKIVQFQKLIRDKIKQAAIKKRSQSKDKRQKFFQEGVNTIKLQMEQSIQQFQAQITKRHKKQSKNKEKDVNQTIKKQIYIYQPSKKLAEAKDQSLLAKLAPFKSQKKRPFECKSLQSQLQQTVEQGKQIKNKQIEEYKHFERQKLRKRHLLQKDVYLSKLQQQNNQTITKLELKRNELDKSERIKMQKLIESNNKATNQRIIALRKSLRSYSIRDESKRIRQIVKNHRETIQFVNNIEQIGDTSNHKNSLSPKYTTLDVSSEWTRQMKANRYDEERLQKKIIRKIKNPTEFDKYDETERTLSNRKSLANLYDQQLKEI